MQTASLAGPARPHPKPELTIVDELAEAMVDLAAAEGCATRDRLLEQGWSEITLGMYETSARERAREIVNRVDDPPAYDRSARMKVAVREGLRIMPTQQVMTMHLQNRGFSKPELDDLLPDIVAEIADAWAHEAGAQ